MPQEFMVNQLQVFLNGGAVRRFHTVSTIQIDTVGAHSHLVACLISMLNLPESTECRLLKAALYHDLAEQEIGDIPSPLKRSAPEIANRISDYEAAFNKANGIDIYLSPMEKNVLSFCDNAAGALFCISEYRCGNSRMLPISKRFLTYMEEIVEKYFMDEENSISMLYRSILGFLEVTVTCLVKGTNP